MQSLAIWPVVVENELEGLFIFGFDQTDALPRNMQRLISVFIQQVSSTILQRKMVFQLEQLATLDGLTGVYNHRAFQDLLSGEMERSKRQNCCFHCFF